MATHPTAPVACVEVGGGSTQTVVLGSGEARVLDGAVPPPGVPLLMAVPGLIEGDRVLAASNLGWFDVDPAEALGLDRSAALLLNDAEAAALGESALRDGAPLVFVGLGTGVGGAVVRTGPVVAAANLLGHTTGFGDALCPCSRTGCLETVAAGWALPDPLPESRIGPLAAAVARAVRLEPLADPPLVVVAGGLARRYPAIVDALAAALPDRDVQPTAAAPELKSASAYGLALAYAQLQERVA